MNIRTSSALENWDSYATCLEGIYKKHNVLQSFAVERNYLYSALKFCEKQWESNFSRVKPVKMVMLSEAPLFGDDKTYIYNKLSPFTAFFQKNDVTQIVGAMPSKIMNDKAELLLRLVEQGFVIIDLFPFALNSQNTSVCYKGPGNQLKQNEYKSLFAETSAYLSIKLRKILDKCNSKPPVFAYRYARVEKNIGEQVNRILIKECGSVFDGLPPVIGSIRSNNMHIDIDKLKTLWGQAKLISS